MDVAGQHMRHEILTQPDAWAAALSLIQAQAGALRDFFQAAECETVVFTGCGSPYYLGMSASASLQELSSIQARAVPASEIWLYPGSALVRGQRTLLVAASRSGQTTELLRACEAFRARGQGDLLTLTCYPDRPLSGLGSVNLVLPSGQEASLVQTRAFTTMYVAVLALAALWSGRDDLVDELLRLPEVCRRLLSGWADVARTLAGDARLDRFYFLGSGPRYGLACELSLKMKEASLSHSEPFHFMEFRHGPKAMVSPAALILGLVSPAGAGHERRVLDESRAQGAHVLAVGEREVDLSPGSGLSDLAAGPLYLPFGQMLALERALANGLDPDKPYNLAAVVTLNE